MDNTFRTTHLKMCYQPISRDDSKGECINNKFKLNTVFVNWKENIKIKNKTNKEIKEVKWIFDSSIWLKS